MSTATVKYSAHAHRKVRPPHNALQCFRLTDEGVWIQDDGEPGLAFSYKGTTDIIPGGRGQCDRADTAPMAVASRCDCRVRVEAICSLNHIHMVERYPGEVCPFDAAMDYTCNLYRCANGRHTDTKGRLLK